jgi:hypothetical protein
MEFSWTWVFAGAAYLFVLAALAILAGIFYVSAKSEFGKYWLASLASASVAVFWTFWGFEISRAIFSLDAFSASYWPWFAGRTFDFSLNGFFVFLRIVTTFLAYLAGFLVLVALTLWNVPQFAGRSRKQTKVELAVFAMALAADWTWLRIIPSVFF